MTLIKKINVHLIHLITMIGFVFFEKNALAEIDCSDVNTTNVEQGDCEALVDFYYAMNGYNQDPDKSWKIYKTTVPTPQGWPWWNTLPIEKWVGVELTNTTPRRVKSLYFTNMINIRGTIPDSINNLTSLHYLSIHGSPSYEAGHIYLPSNLSGLVNLTILSFYNSNLSGEISESLPPNLGRINIVTNENLSGKIPSSLFSLPKLNYINISDNKQLTGTLPEIDNFPSMSSPREVNLSWNKLSGEIPSWIINKSSISGLSLAGNKFSGKIPDINRNSSGNNFVLDLTYNELTELPSTFNDTKMIAFYASNNKLTGEIPTSYFEPTQFVNLNYLTNKFEVLALDHNELSGSLPSQIWSPVNFYIENNRISGEIPYLLNTPFKPYKAWYQNNNFTGVLNLPQVNGYQEFINVSQNCLSRPKKEVLNIIKPNHFFEQKPCGWQPKYWEIDLEPTKKGLKEANKGENENQNNREFIRSNLKHSPNRFIELDFIKEIEKINMQK
ncbi:MAG: hypothetical protein QE271_02365 [Bacteriovoracaceae bacterium]|nr:hypothetical protein [Bacteriovoracaceae bacterium]